MIAVTPSLRTITIEEAVECLIDYRGKTPPKTASGVRLVTAKVIKGGQILSEPAEYIAADFYDQWMRRGLPRDLDVLITTEAPLGEVALLRLKEPIALAQRVILLRAKADQVDPRFLFHAMQSEFTQAELHARASGTTVFGIKQSELRKVRLQVPPLPVQRRIAGILSAYDDLIENCERRIRVLDEMARALYREWFVDAPAQAITGTFADLATLVRSAVDPRRHANEVFAHFSIPAFDAGRTPVIEPGGAIQSNKQLVPAGCVLLSKLNPRIPRAWLPVVGDSHRSVASTEFLVLEPRAAVGVTQEFLYCLCSSADFSARFTALAIGTSNSHQRVKPESLLRLPMARPDARRIAAASECWRPWIQQMEVLRGEIRNLRQTRDLLLPRLLSGHLCLVDVA